jgi:hypothetical protein
VGSSKDHSSKNTDSRSGSQQRRPSLGQDEKAAAKEVLGDLFGTPSADSSKENEAVGNTVGNNQDTEMVDVSGAAGQAEIQTETPLTAETATVWDGNWWASEWRVEEGTGYKYRIWSDTQSAETNKEYGKDIDVTAAEAGGADGANADANADADANATHPEASASTAADSSAAAASSSGGAAAGGEMDELFGVADEVRGDD